MKSLKRIDLQGNALRCIKPAARQSVERLKDFLKNRGGEAGVNVHGRAEGGHARESRDYVGRAEDGSGRFAVKLAGSETLAPVELGTGGKVHSETGRVSTVGRRCRS